MEHDSLDSKLEQVMFSHSNKIIFGTMAAIASVYAVAAYGPEMLDMAEEAYYSVCRKIEQIPYQSFP